MGKTNKYDVLIIGAGVSGSAVARELSRRERRIAVLERENDVCEGTSKANSGIVHAGYDAIPGTLKAKLNVEGSRRMEALSKELDFSFKRNGSLVVSFEEEGKAKLQELYERGQANGVKDLRLLTGDEAREKEPQLSEEVKAALYAPTAGIVCPFGLNLALAENAAQNGVDFYLNTEVTAIDKEADGYRVLAGEQEFFATVVVNAAGVYADTFHNMVSEHPMRITPRRGEYCLFDKTAGNLVRSTIFQLPSAKGKGILVTPTVHGNLMAGPTAEDISDKEGTNTTAAGLDMVLQSGARSVKNLPVRQVITSFAGLRAHEKSGDFIIKEAEDAPGFFDVAGIASPGLSAPPAIGVYVAELIQERFPAPEKIDFIATRKGIPNMAEASTEERQELIRQNPAFANVICRCELVTEGEILAAIHRPLGATTLGGIKRRTRAGMGRCQAGFCSPKTVEILERELGADNSQTVKKDIVIIGGGPAGLAAALAAREAGIEKVLILERDKELGGILNQCIHNGFGLHTFKEELTGPEYAARYADKVKQEKIPFYLHTIVIDIILLENGEKMVTAMNREKGLFQIQTKAVILAMGCRERPRGALNIPGTRPAGIYSAGTAQHYVNIEGRLPGKEVVILGSGDIGLIMARRMTLEGADVKAVAELMPYSGGLKRNIAQCLDDFGIPLKLSHTVIDIEGKERVTSVTLAQVDENRKPIPGTEEKIPCDTLLLSCGLIPENELSSGLGVKLNPVTSGPVVNESLETNIPGVFACGNVLHVHDLVDYVSEEAATAGVHAAVYVKENMTETSDNICQIAIKAEQGVRYTVPSSIRISHMEESQLVRFRVGDVYKAVYLTVYLNDTPVMSQKKRVMAPGEMEQVRLKKEQLLAFPDLQTITLKIEKENPLLKDKEVH